MSEKFTVDYEVELAGEEGRQLRELQQNLDAIRSNTDSPSSITGRFEEGRAAGVLPLKQALPSGSGAPSDIARNALTDDIQEVESIRELLEKEFGPANVDNFFNILKNPDGFAEGILLRGLPVLAGLQTFKEILEFTIIEMTKRGRPLSVLFQDIIETRIDPFLDKERANLLRGGFDQLLLASADGTLGPRTPYNTLELFRTGEIQNENRFKIRRPSS